MICYFEVFFAANYKIFAGIVIFIFQKNLIICSKKYLKIANQLEMSTKPKLIHNL
ncbi:hypothetical protein APHACPA_0455 [Rickettsia amblyommatis str. Ac/Pa]|uniref:Uncharacterized protein n=1 Tax=Rickettsia amblyommatis str. Ac/Pa TaxID=1359164 RepID=A0A0F3N077_RICAM|nr:hypothetical protein APHACPA_0455 [Rickettsia amblyommatis str. Ac/Pa]